MKRETEKEWLERISHDTGRVVRRETHSMTKDEVRAQKIREQQEDDDIRRSRQCRLS